MTFSAIRSRFIMVLLILMSIALYGVDYLVTGGKLEDIVTGFLGNLAFLPVYVLFVTLMIERVLKQREKMALRQKLNMVIGVFFSEVGTRLIKDCSGFIDSVHELDTKLHITPQWKESDFRQALSFLATFDVKIDSRRGDLPLLKSFLVGKRPFMLGLLENPNLLEHDEFTDLLWAVFHLMEELEARQSLTGLSSTDLDHLSGDIRRVYAHLLREWLVYVRHLQQDYPYLFSLAVRLNPLDPAARAELT